MHQIDLRRIDLNLLPVFDVLMSERHVSRAAERLGRTQSAISHALERLREQLGDPLLVRVGGEMRPSPRALDLMVELKPILQSMQRVLSPREAFDPARSQRHFRIVLPDFWSGTISRFLAITAQTAPGITVEWLAPRETSLLDVAAAQLDLVVAPTRSSPPEGVESEFFGAHLWQSFLRQAHPAIPRWSQAEWLAYPHVVVAVGDRLQSPIQMAHATLSAERKVGVYVPNFRAVAPILARTDMIATLPTLAVGDDALHYNLVALAPPLDIPPIAQSLYWSLQQANEPALTWLRAMIRPLLTIPG